MCIGGGSSVAYPEVPSTRDTSKELIVSNYELSEENKKKNASIIAAKNRAKSLVNFDNDSGGDGDNGMGAGTSIGGSSSGGNYGGMDMSNIG